ncbi:coiled-coil domain-containing protein 86-like [Tubulanus polymorphus]|uniref:coiled-coil domain-containing protein 86-like n=1 Tax=Tubulanus polymorphus TaxID=672921 RepID=UPI003DA55FC4
MGKTNKDMKLPEVPRGKPKSGRVWKNTRMARASDMVAIKSFKTSWNRKMQAKSDKMAVKLREKELKEARSAKKEAARLRSEEKKKQKLENERKSEIVQPIRDTRKIKRMKKTQLRTIEKR